MKLRIWIQFPSLVDATQIRNVSIDAEVENVEKLAEGFWCYRDANHVLRMSEHDDQCQYLVSGYQIRMVENLEYNEAKVKVES